MQWQDVRDRIMSSGAVAERSRIGRRTTVLMDLASSNIHEEEPLVLWAFQPGRAVTDRRGLSRR
jgi:hypothetical protein